MRPPTPPQPDYTTWTSPSLIARITALETQLRTHHISPADPSAALPQQAPQKKPRKSPKPFDPSKYATRHIALKFAYLGARYNGFEHHSNNATPLPTVEEALWRGLRKCRLIFPTWPEGKGEGEREEVCWDGTGYSKCGRTDRGVSAFGQVVGLRVRSARPVGKGRRAEVQKGAAEVEAKEGGDSPMPDAGAQEDVEVDAEVEEPVWDDVVDELPYIQLLNRVLPADIRVLAWCPDPPPDFSARFNCKERRYRYFFTNPAYAPTPLAPGEGQLDVEAMQKAAQKYEGLHDFRNFCKVDPSKQLTNFERRIFHSGIHRVGADQDPGSFAAREPFVGQKSQNGQSHSRPDLQRMPELFYFEVRGSAFLWHQVRHLVAILFLVGQGYEQPSVVEDLLDVKKTPEKPTYEMASDAPLVLWDCVFPDLSQVSEADHAHQSGGEPTSYQDSINWIYVGEEVGGRDTKKRSVTGLEDGKYGRNGIMEDLWGMWRQRKMEEVLAGSLMDAVARLGKQPKILSSLESVGRAQETERLFDGSEEPRSVGRYKPVMQRDRMEAPEVVNARYAARKGLNGTRSGSGDASMDA